MRDLLSAAHGSIRATKIHEAIPSLAETTCTGLRKVSSFPTTVADDSTIPRPSVAMYRARTAGNVGIDYSYFSGTVAAPFGGTNAKSLSSRPELIARLVNCMVTVFSNWS